MVDVAGPNNRADRIFQHVYFYRDSRNFQHIPISTVEFSNTFQHEYRNSPVNFFTHCGIFQHFKTYIVESFRNECRILYTLKNSPTFQTYIEESQLCWFLALHKFYFRCLLIPIQQQPKRNQN